MGKEYIPWPSTTLYKMPPILKYEGGFKYNLYDVFGSLYTLEGLCYIGGFLKGKFHGEGTEYYPGTLIPKRQGYFIGGILVHGMEYDSNGALIRIIDPNSLPSLDYLVDD